MAGSSVQMMQLPGVGMTNYELQLAYNEMSAHDHKSPIPMKDMWVVAGVFASRKMMEKALGSGTSVSETLKGNLYVCGKDDSPQEYELYQVE